MMELLVDKIAAIIREARENQTMQVPYANYADRVLEIPELKEALETAAGLRANQERQRRMLGHSISTDTRQD
jgi:hypothetical protein